MSFPGAVYRNKTKFNWKIYCSRYSECRAIFQHIPHRNWDFCHIMGPTFVFLCRRSLSPGIGTTVRHSSLLLCHSENGDADQTGISWGIRKNGNHWERGSCSSYTRSSLMMDGLSLCSSSCTCCRPAENCLHQWCTICLFMTLGP